MATPDSILSNPRFPPAAELEMTAGQLRVIFSIIVTVADAMESGRISRTEDYARCLRHCVLNVLDDEILRLEEIARLPPSAA